MLGEFSHPDLSKIKVHLIDE